MRQRCNNPKYSNYKYYGGRGIKVCKGWNSFSNFLRDMGERPEGTSINRIDNDGNYSCGKCPECIANGWMANCEWATYEKQNHNRGLLNTNKSGHTGVMLLDGKWKARIMMNYKNIDLGSFTSKEYAIAAYDKASEKYHRVTI